MYKIADKIMGYMKFNGNLNTIQELIDYPDPKVGDILYVQEHSANYVYTLLDGWLLLDHARVQEYTQLETILNPQNLQRCYVMRDSKTYIYLNGTWTPQFELMGKDESIFDDIYLAINIIDVIKWIDNRATPDQKAIVLEHLKEDIGNARSTKTTSNKFRLDSEGRLKNENNKRLY